jgi:hypothetical protein
MRRASPFLAAIAITPALVMLIQQMIAISFLKSLSILSVPVLSGYMTLPYWVVSIINLSLATLAAVWFIIAATRAFRAAVSHPSRRPAGIAALIAALALLDAVSAAMLQATFISIACIFLWFFTRWLQRRIAGS